MLEVGKLFCAARGFFARQSCNTKSTRTLPRSKTIDGFTTFPCGLPARGQGQFVGKFQPAAGGQAVGDARNFQVRAARTVSPGNSSVASPSTSVPSAMMISWMGSLSGAFQFRDAQIFRFHAVQRRNFPAQHMKLAAKGAGLFHAQNVHRAFHHADSAASRRGLRRWRRGIFPSARRRSSQKWIFSRASRIVSASCLTTAESVWTRCSAMRSAERGPTPGSLASAAMSCVMESGSMKRYMVEALHRRQSSKYDADQHSRFRIHIHPIPGRLKPAVTLPISVLEISLAWPSAWFAAVRIMSSSNCASDGFSACGSILIAAIVPSHLAVTLTAPPPLVASTVRAASCAWICSICCCIRAACFINFPMLDIISVNVVES